MSISDKGSLMIEVGAGEFIDKITILKIKTARINDPAKLANVNHELDVLNRARAVSISPSVELDQMENALRGINEALWIIEDDIRACEAVRDFGPKFIELARSVYFQNDKRAAIKKAINEHCGSRIIEEKSYTKFS